jgi:hypothetical protein
MIFEFANFSVLFLLVAFPLILWRYQSLRPKCVLSPVQCEEFFEYTSGRWLYNEDRRELFGF